MHPYISQSLATEHIVDAQRQARAARLAAKANHARRLAVWHRLVRSA